MTRERTVLCGIVFGGKVAPGRRDEIARGERPRIDELEMEARWGAHVRDMGWFEAQAERSLVARCLRALAGRIGLWSLFLAVLVARRAPAGVVYATGEDVGLPLAAALRLARRRDVRVVMRLEQWSLGRSVLRRTVHSLGFAFAAARIDLVLCRTRAHEQLLLETLRLPRAKVRLVPETTDARFFDPGQPVADEVEVPPAPFILSGGLEMRDYETLLAAVDGLPVRVVIAAGSPWSHFRFGDGREVALPPGVTVASYSPRAMRELYRAAAFVVVPVRPTLRSCGISVVLEAWAMGRAVVATRTAGLGDYIRAGEDGLLVEPGDSAALREAIARLLRHPEEARRMGANGRTRVETELNQERFLGEVARAVGDVRSR